MFLVLGALPYVTGSLSDALNINSVGIRVTVSNCANMPMYDSGVYYVISTFSNVANEYFTIAYKLSGPETGGSWFAFIKNTMSSINWTRLDVPNFYKDYSMLASLTSAMGARLKKKNSTLIEITDFNDYQKTTVDYFDDAIVSWSQSAQNAPKTSCELAHLFVYNRSEYHGYQMVLDVFEGNIFFRSKASQVWSNWKKFTLTAV